jgi:hypothetical protein
LLARASNHINARASIGRTAEVFCDSLFRPELYPQVTDLKQRCGTSR